MLKILLSLVSIIFLTNCGSVDTGHRGVMVRFGEITSEPLSEGLYFYNFITTSLKEIDIRQQKWSEKTEIFTKDTQKVDVDFTIVYSVQSGKVVSIFKDVGTLGMLEEKLIKPVILGSIKDAIGQVIADELVSKREVVTKAALAEVRENLKDRYVDVLDLQFTNLNFDNAYEKAVEEKVVAIQNAQKAKNETVRIEEEAKQTVKTAQAEAEAMRIKSQALSQNKGLVEFEIAKKWNGVLPMYMFGNSTPLLNLNNIK